MSEDKEDTWELATTHDKEKLLSHHGENHQAARDAAEAITEREPTRFVVPQYCPGKDGTYQWCVLEFFW